MPCVDLARRHIDDGELVSIYGSRITGMVVFRDRPRPQDRGSLSAIAGEVSPAEACSLVRLAATPSSDDGVRYARVGDLRSHGFAVSHSPSRRNPRHCQYIMKMSKSGMTL